MAEETRAEQVKRLLAKLVTIAGERLEEVGGSSDWRTELAKLRQMPSGVVFEYAYSELSDLKERLLGVKGAGGLLDLFFELWERYDAPFPLSDAVVASALSDREFSERMAANVAFTARCLFE